MPLAAFCDLLFIRQPAFALSVIIVALCAAGLYFNKSFIDEARREAAQRVASREHALPVNVVPSTRYATSRAIPSRLVSTGDEVSYAGDGVGRRFSGSVSRPKRLGLVVEQVKQRGGSAGSGGAAKGVLVRAVENGSPAERAGIRTGDAIFEVNGHPVHSVTGLVSLTREAMPGERFSVRTQRGFFEVVIE